MEQILEDIELIGKKITKIGYTDNRYALFFDDGTYAIFRGCGWDENDVELMHEGFSLEPTISNAYELRDMGVITNEKYKEINQIYEKEQEIKKTEKERKEYERLKLKYSN